MLRADLMAGLTVALVLIPQSMAYAKLAGLPAYYGLYAAFLPTIVAALWGSSRQLATGPVAVVSLLTATILEPLATSGGQAYIQYAILLALIVGLFQLALGLLRLGVVINFISHPVVNGFTNAAAIIIATSQFSNLFGVHVAKAEKHYQTVFRVIEAAFNYTHWPTLFMGVLAILIMYTLKRFFRSLPNILIAVVITTIISWAIGYEKNQLVPLSDIQGEKVKRLIAEHDAALGEISRMTENRAEANLAIQTAPENKNFDELDILILKNEIEVLTVLIEKERRKAEYLKTRLRALRFLAAQLPGGGGTTVYYPTDEVLEGFGGRLWRLSVGNRPLGQDRLLLSSGGEVIGNIPAGLPAIGPPSIDWRMSFRLFPQAVIIALLGFMEAVSVARAMAARTGQRLDPNQELIGQGLANIVGSFFRSYPTSGSFSRSAVNLEAGGRTGLSSVFTGLTVLLALLFLTPLLYHLPSATLAAVIMMAVIGLVNISGFIHALKAQWYDGAISIITFVVTLALAPHLDVGIMIGVGLSLIVFLYKSMRPRVAALAMGPDGTFHDARHFHLERCKRIAVIRFDAPLFYANASLLEDQITEQRRSMPVLKHIIIACDGMNDIDTSGEQTLSLIVDRIRSAGLKISFTTVHSNVLDVWRKTHLFSKIGDENIYPTLIDAILSVHAEAHKDSDNKPCPLLSVCPSPPADEGSPACPLPSTVDNSKE